MQAAAPRRAAHDGYAVVGVRAHVDGEPVMANTTASKVGTKIDYSFCKTEQETNFKGLLT